MVTSTTSPVTPAATEPPPMPARKTAPPPEGARRSIDILVPLVFRRCGRLLRSSPLWPARDLANPSSDPTDLRPYRSTRASGRLRIEPRRDADDGGARLAADCPSVRLAGMVNRQARGCADSRAGARPTSRRARSVACACEQVHLLVPSARLVASSERSLPRPNKRATRRWSGRSARHDDMPRCCSTWRSRFGAPVVVSRGRVSVWRATGTSGFGSIASSPAASRARLEGKCWRSQPAASP